MENTVDSTLLLAKRGYMYEWENFHTGKKNNCVIVSAEDRSADNLVAILFFSTERHNNKDEVPLKVGGEKGCVRTGLVTYTSRKYLTREIGPVSAEVMKRIDLQMSRDLGLNTDNAIYKELYEGLLASIIDSKQKEANKEFEEEQEKASEEKGGMFSWLKR